MKRLLFLFIFFFTSCMITEPDVMFGTYEGDNELVIKVKSDDVREFNLTTSFGKLSLTGYWDIVNNSFTIETFSDNLTITIIGVFDTDTSVYGEWYIEDEKGEWEGYKVIEIEEDNENEDSED